MLGQWELALCTGQVIAYNSKVPSGSKKALLRYQGVGMMFLKCFAAFNFLCLFLFSVDSRWFSWTSGYSSLSVTGLWFLFVLRLWKGKHFYMHSISHLRKLTILVIKWLNSPALWVLYFVDLFGIFQSWYL